MNCGSPVTEEPSGTKLSEEDATSRSNYGSFSYANEKVCLLTRNRVNEWRNTRYIRESVTITTKVVNKLFAVKDSRFFLATSANLHPLSPLPTQELNHDVTAANHWEPAVFDAKS